MEHKKVGIKLREESLLKVSFEIIKTKSIMFFLITSSSIFLGATYFYNKKFPSHKYPEWLEFLKFIA